MARSNFRKARVISCDVMTPHFLSQVKQSSPFATRVTHHKPTRATSASQVEPTRASPVESTRITHILPTHIYSQVTQYWIPKYLITNPSIEASTSSVAL